MDSMYMYICISSFPRLRPLLSRLSLLSLSPLTVYSLSLSLYFLYSLSPILLSSWRSPSSITSHHCIS